LSDVLQFSLNLDWRKFSC